MLQISYLLSINQMHYKLKSFTLIFLCFASVGNAQQFNNLNNKGLDSSKTYESIHREKFKIMPFILPAAFATYGFIASNSSGALNRLDRNTQAELQKKHPNFSTSVDNYLQFAPVAAYYALDLSGVKGKHSLCDASLLYVTSFAIMGGSTFIVKKIAGRPRPDGSGNNSFPSGHTASAFAAAEFLHQEYKDRSPFIAYSGFVAAAATGALRLYNNKHWFSDTVAGAGFGIASTKIAYLVYPYMKEVFGSKKHENISFMPSYQNGVPSLFVAAQF